MKKRIAALAAAVLAVALCASATTKSGDAENAKSKDVKSEDVKIYGPAQLNQGEYETVTRIWSRARAPRSGSRPTTHTTNGIAALKDKAASLDASGLINVDCYGDSGLFGESQVFTCYGKAVKVR